MILDGLTTQAISDRKMVKVSNLSKYVFLNHGNKQKEENKGM